MGMKKMIVVSAAAMSLLAACGGEDATVSVAGVDGPDSSPSPTQDPPTDGAPQPSPEPDPQPSPEPEPDPDPSPEPSPEPEPEPSPEPTPEPTPEGSSFDVSEDDFTTNSRGNIEAAVGEPMYIFGDSGEPIAQFTLVGIEDDFECTRDYARESENGRFLKLDFELITDETLAQETIWTTVTIDGWDMRILDPDGRRENDSRGSASSCLTNAESMPYGVGPGETVAGSIVLDTGVESGVVILDMRRQGSWEWEF